MHIFLIRFLNAFSAPFGSLLASFAPLGFLLGLFGSPLAAFSSLFTSFECLLVPLGLLMVHFGTPFGSARVQMAAKMQPKPPKWFQKVPKIRRVRFLGAFWRIFLEFPSFNGSHVGSNLWQVCIRK